MKILFINPPSPLGAPALPPLGLLYLASVAKADGNDVKIIDLDMDEPLFGDLEEIILDYSPDIVGLTGTTPQANNLIKIAKITKSISKTILVIAGGPHASALPERLLRESDGNIDIVVIGEGEITLSEIIKGYELKNIDGICYFGNGNIIRNKPRMPLEDLDSIPFPDRGLLNINKYPGLYPVKETPSVHMIASRGCPFKCKFCSEKVVFGRKYRKRSPLNVLGEIKYLINTYGIKEIAFYDDIFTIDKKWVLEFCRYIKENRLKFSWKILSRVNTVDKELLSNLKSAGCWLIYYGFESGSQKILDSIGKGTTVEQNINVARLTRQVGIKIYGFFMLGNPGETRETALETIKHAKKIKPDWFQFSITRPDPGSELYAQYQKEIESQNVPWEEYYAFPSNKIKMPIVGTGLTPEELLKLKEYAYNFLVPQKRKLFLFIKNVFNKILQRLFPLRYYFILGRIKDFLNCKKADFKGKTILITGAGKGIGRALSILSASLGMNVVAISRTKDDIDSLIAEIEENNGKIIGIVSDISNEHQIKYAVRKAIETFGKIDFLVNNAAIGKFCELINLNPKDINSMVEINLKGIINFTKCVLPFMLRRRQGTIINVSSMLGLNAGPTESVYAATKFGVIGFTVAMAKELKDYNVTVSALCPGTVDTSFADGRNKTVDKSQILHPNEVARSMISLLGKSSRIVSIIKWNNKLKTKIVNYL